MVKACPGSPRRIRSRSRSLVLEEAGLHAGDQVVVEALEDGVGVRRGELSFDRAFGALTGTYPPGYLERRPEDAER